MKKTVMNNFPASKKVYVEGSQGNIRVPFREIEQTPTVTTRGEEINSPFVFMIRVVPIQMKM